MTKQAHSSAQSTDQPSAASLLKPELKKVLGNLNVHLEDELTRYRRQRRGQAPPPPARIKTAQLSQKQLDLISIQAKEISPSDPEKRPAATTPLPPPPPPNPFLQLSEDTNKEPSVDDLPAAAAVSSASANPEAALPQELAVHQDSAAPDSYLASSEELLKSLADEQEEDLPPLSPAQPYRPSRRDQLLTPLKMGLLLLLLVSGVGVGYAIVNPSVLSPILSRLRPETTAGDAENTASEVTVDEAGNPDFSPLGPDLSTREFLELDLKSLSTLDVEAQAPLSPAASTSTATTLPGTGTALPAPGATAQPPAPTPGPAALTPAPTQSATPSPGSSVPPTAAPAPTTPAPTPAATGSNYYVITDYTGDASLAKAREVVGDAFVRNYKEGSRIQLGAFDNATSAQQLIQELQSRGLSGRLYGPTDE